MANQSQLFEAGRPTLPDHVTVFASGANEAREIRGFQLAAVPVGVAVSLLRESAIRELLNCELPVFADSGAFSECVFTIDGQPTFPNPITGAEWKRRLSIYRRLAESLGGLLSIVAPDRVADQDVTLQRLCQYRDELAGIAALGADILIPVQNGALSPVEFYRTAVRASGLDLVPAMPMKKAATAFAEVLAFVQEVQPRRIHLLGMGYERNRARKLVAMLQAISPEMEISLDSNRLRAVTGQGRVMTKTETVLRGEEPEFVYAEVQSEALNLAGYRLDYTDSIAFPSTWATDEQLRTIAVTIGLTSTAWAGFLADPDGFLQQEIDGYDSVAYIELPQVAQALDAAWQQHVKAEIDESVRIAAIRTTFSDARIASRAVVGA
jgi:hypothetical protein